MFLFIFLLYGLLVTAHTHVGFINPIFATIDSLRDTYWHIGQKVIFRMRRSGYLKTRVFPPKNLIDPKTAAK